MTRITILLPSLRGGGMEKELLLIAEELIKRNFSIEVVVVNTIQSAYTPSSKINLIDLGATQIRYAIFPLIKYLKQSKPEIIFCAETPLNTIAILAKKITGFPKQLIISERNHISSVTKYAKRFGDLIRPHLVKYLYPYADKVVTVSKGVAQDLITTCQLHSHKVQTLYNMFDVENIKQKSTEEATHLPKDNLPIILNIGRLSPQKDQATLIKAFAIVRKKTPCHLIILGEGAERSNLIQLIRQLNLENDILMPGFVSNPYAYIARANVFVLSSMYEGLPGVLIEALACGTSIVSTNCPSGPAEILEHGKYGILTPVGDEDALANAMQKLLQQPYAPDILRARAMDFSIERLIPHYINLFTPPQT
jgi:glycosyltransferase involved in cell wall biosynthesis